MSPSQLRPRSRWPNSKNLLFSAPGPDGGFVEHPQRGEKHASETRFATFPWKRGTLPHDDKRAPGETVGAASTGSGSGEGPKIRWDRAVGCDSGSQFQRDLSLFRNRAGGRFEARTGGDAPSRTGGRCWGVDAVPGVGRASGAERWPGHRGGRDPGSDRNAAGNRLTQRWQGATRGKALLIRVDSISNDGKIFFPLPCVRCNNVGLCRQLRC